MRILDTTFLVDFLRRAPEVKRLAQDLEDRGERPATTEVNAFELLVGAYEEGRINQERFAQVQQMLQGLDVLALNPERSSARGVGPPASWTSSWLESRWHQDTTRSSRTTRASAESKA